MNYGSLIVMIICLKPQAKSKQTKKQSKPSTVTRSGVCVKSTSCSSTQIHHSHLHDFFSLLFPQRDRLQTH